MSKLIWLTLFGVLLLSSCRRNAIPEPSGPVDGLRPIYMSANDIREVGSGLPQVINNPGSIFYKGQYLYVSQPGQGIHVVDNTDPSNPVPVSFITIPGNQDLAVKEDILYADNGPDLLTIDISDPLNVLVLKRDPNVFPPVMFPDELDVYFECVDPTQGVVIGWEPVVLPEVTCFR